MTDIDDFRVVAVIPARKGSKGVPGKNTRALNGRPLLSYALDAAKQSRRISRALVSTDCPETAALVRELGGDAPFLRPAEIAGDQATLLSVVRHACGYLRDQGEEIDAVFSLQPTAPFVTARHLDEAVETMVATGCDCVTAVSAITQGHPYISKRLDTEGRITNFVDIPKGVDVSSRQSRPPAYYLTGAFYLRRMALVDDPATAGHALGQDCRAVVLDEFAAVDINTEMDFRFADFVARLEGPR